MSGFVVSNILTYLLRSSDLLSIWANDDDRLTRCRYRCWLRPSSEFDREQNQCSNSDDEPNNI